MGDFSSKKCLRIEREKWCVGREWRALQRGYRRRITSTSHRLSNPKPKNHLSARRSSLTSSPETSPSSWVRLGCLRSSLSMLFCFVAAKSLGNFFIIKYAICFLFSFFKIDVIKFENCVFLIPSYLFGQIVQERGETESFVVITQFMIKLS